MSSLNNKNSQNTFSHINSMGEANMVDVSEKKISTREAVAKAHWQ